MFIVIVESNLVFNTLKNGLPWFGLEDVVAAEVDYPEDA
jgi:hypothetical protein